jgi:triosephosphate isomerase
MSEKISKEYNVNIAVAPQAPDIHRISSEVNIPVFSQHIDAIRPGSNTGKILIDTIKEAGAIGTLINHSENRLKIADIEELVKSTKKYSMISVVCTNNMSVSGSAAILNPDFIAFEPPELIGSGISVSKAQPEIVSETVKFILKLNPNVIPLCGAGISTGEDVKSALDLGTKGVLLASGVVKSNEPEKVLKSLIEPLI